MVFSFDVRAIADLMALRPERQIALRSKLKTMG